MLEFRPPTDGDIAELAARARPADRVECAALGHPDMHAVVARGVGVSSWAVAARIDSRVAAIFGVAPLDGALLSDTGVPWLIGTDLISTHRRAFVRHAPRYISLMLQTHPHLVNVVHTRNALAVRWLQRAGFALEPAQPLGPMGETFHTFRMSA